MNAADAWLHLSDDPGIDVFVLGSFGAVGPAVGASVGVSTL